MILSGFPEVLKVYSKQYVCQKIDPKTGETYKVEKNWMIETDGTALKKIFPVDRVDFQKTTSNDIVEI